MPKTAIKKFSIKTAVEMLVKAKEAYYAGSPLMSDDEFDKCEEILRAEDPENTYFTTVGAKGNSKTKFQHKVPMLSAGKAKTTDEVWAWLTKIGATTESILVEPKIDGLSATIGYAGGKLQFVATRGDGAVGQDISHIAPFLDTIPKTITDKSEIEVRGELYIPKTTKCPAAANSPLRNLAVGFINRKGGKHSLADLKYVKFVAYQVIGSKYNHEFLKLEALENLGFNVVETSTFTDRKGLDKIHAKYLATDRAAWEYETDGLVCVVNDNHLHAKIDSLYNVSHHHHYNIALKPPSEGKETELLGIEWNVSRQGKLIPIALVKPVVLGGATVQRCTLNNYENVVALKLHTGDKVMIERANDVIPFFKKNLTPHADMSKKLDPEYCPACKHYDLKRVGVHLMCVNKDCVEQEILKVVHWVKNCEMEAFAEASIRQLFAAKKIKNIKDLYALKATDFDGVEGFGKSKSKNALEQIEGTKSMTIGQFVDRLGIDLVGEKAIAKLGIETAKQMLAHTDETFVIGKNLKEYVAENRDFIEDLLACVNIQAPTKAKAGANLVCMTGAGPETRDKLVDKISKKGDTFIDRVTRETNILICEDVNGGSSKLEKARKLGVKLISYEEYFK